MQGVLRVSYRFVFFVVYTIYTILFFMWLVALGTDKKAAGLRVRRKWLNRIPPVMGLEMRMEGTPYQQTCLFVGNHITYIDPIAVLAHIDAQVVAKAEIKHWPLVGLGAYLVGTLFVNREEKSSRQETALAIRNALEHGDSILVYPEGTTTAGPGTLPFKPRSFLAAHLAGVPVQPIAIQYDSPKVPYIGDDTFLPHFFRLFRMKNVTGRIAFGPLLTGQHTADEARAWIHQVQFGDHPQSPIHERT